MSSFQIFDEKDILQAKYDLLQHTTMVDFQLDIYKKLHLDGGEPKGFIIHLALLTE